MQTQCPLENRLIMGKSIKCDNISPSLKLCQEYALSQPVTITPFTQQPLPCQYADAEKLFSSTTPFLCFCQADLIAKSHHLPSGFSAHAIKIHIFNYTCFSWSSSTLSIQHLSFLEVSCPWEHMCNQAWKASVAYFSTVITSWQRH